VLLIKKISAPQRLCGESPAILAALRENITMSCIQVDLCWYLSICTQQFTI